MLQRISLRPAQPTLADGALFARYLDTSADGLFRLMLGAAFERVVAEANVEPAHDHSFEHSHSRRGETQSLARCRHTHLSSTGARLMSL